MIAKKQPEAFTSFRIIGKKAQRLFARAKSSLKGEGERQKIVPLPEPEKHPEVVIRLSIASLAQALFVALLIIVGVWTVYHIRQKLILLLLAAFVATVIDPGVQLMQRFGVPRGFAVIAHYLIAVFIIGFLIFSMIPIIALQLQQIAQFLATEVNTFLLDQEISLPFVPESINRQMTILAQDAVQKLSIDQFANSLQEWGRNLSSAALGTVGYATVIAGNVATFIVSFIVVLVLAFFMQIEKEKIIRWMRSFFPGGYRTYLASKSEAIHYKIGQWARGELLLMLSIGILTFIALTILDMPYALTLAVLAGFCELIPVVGPLFAAIPAVLIGFTQEGWIWAIVLAGVYYVIQWCENNLLVPLIMKRAVGLSPIAIIFAMMVGISFPNTVHPILGVILAIPTTTIITIFLEDWRAQRERMHG